MPKTRIEKLGELYDKAIENVSARLGQPVPHDQTKAVEVVSVRQMTHSIDMQVIETYLHETRQHNLPRKFDAPRAE